MAFGAPQGGAALAPYERFAASKTSAEAEFSSAEHGDGPGPPPGGSRVGNHAENEYNNRCDQLAVAESQKYK